MRSALAEHWPGSSRSCVNLSIIECVVDNFRSSVAFFDSSQQQFAHRSSVVLCQCVRTHGLLPSQPQLLCLARLYYYCSAVAVAVTLLLLLHALLIALRESGASAVLQERFQQKAKKEKRISVSRLEARLRCGALWKPWKLCAVVKIVWGDHVLEVQACEFCVKKHRRHLCVNQ